MSSSVSSHLVDGSFRPQTRSGDTTNLPKFVLYFLVQHCLITCWTPQGFLHSFGKAGGGALYRRLAFAIRRERPNLRIPLILMRCGRVFSEPIPNNKLLTCALLTQSFHSSDIRKTEKQKQFSTKTPCLSIGFRLSSVCLSHSASSFH